MDFASLLKIVPIIISVIDTVRNLTASGATNEGIAGVLKNIIPANIFAQIQSYAQGLFDNVKPALQVVAAVQTSIDPNRNKTIQNLLNTANDVMKLGVAPLAVDGDYGPKTKEMAIAVQRKLGGDIVADGWIGSVSLSALQLYMQSNQKAVAASGEAKLI